MGGLSFAAPLALLGLLALPALWLLIRQAPPAPKRVAFPGVYLLRQLQDAEQTPARTSLWTLILRALLITALTLGLAGPVLDDNPETTTSDPLLIVFENTWPAAADFRRLRRTANDAAARAEAAGRSVLVVVAAPETGETVLAPLEPNAAAIPASIAPVAWRPHRAALAQLIDAAAPARAETLWIADGLAGDDDPAFARRLAARGPVSLVAPPLRAALAEARPVADGIALSAVGVERGATVPVTAYGQDGRLLGGADLTAEADGVLSGVLPLPPGARAGVRIVRIDGVGTAGAARLVDARTRRPRVGLATLADLSSRELLTGFYYADRALAPHADLSRGALFDLADEDLDAIVLDDRGALRPREIAALNTFVAQGGVFIRFAGPRLARATREGDILTPAPLRGDARSLDGALSWEAPQDVAPFPAESPFAGIAPPENAAVKRQVLASPGALLDEDIAVWAYLADGTPLVTARRSGDGWIVLFHVTLDPDWSDLPLSGAFVEMLRRAALAGGGKRRGEDGGPDGPLAAISTLSGYGAVQPAGAAPAVAVGEDAPAGPDRRPGFYGDPAAPAAINALRPDEPYEPLATPAGVRRLALEDGGRLELGRWLIAAAGVFFLIDLIAAAVAAGAVRAPRLRAASIAALAVFASPLVYADPASAQSAAEDKALEAALATRLAYVRTGDAQVDETSRLGLEEISRELARRTSVEPGPPMAIDLETDELAVFAFLYWPISSNAVVPSDAALAAVDRFAATGGLVVFDTRDAPERALGIDTAQTRRLGDILRRLGAPPLREPPGDHVLFRSFFLLNDLTGRYANGPVLIAADAGVGADGVSGYLIGGRDWASAWAVDPFGRPIRPLEPNFPRQREFAIRAGVNMAMVSLSGNYKSDQLHLPELLRRLEGR
ncbi:MAG: DUF4159 domain-containing protein [Pseudomonadota bacterium]